MNKILSTEIPLCDAKISCSLNTQLFKNFNYFYCNRSIVSLEDKVIAIATNSDVVAIELHDGSVFTTEKGRESLWYFGFNLSVNSR